MQTKRETELFKYKKCNHSSHLDEESPFNDRPNPSRTRPKTQQQNSRAGSGGSSRPHTGYGKTRTTESNVNGFGKGTV